MGLVFQTALNIMSKNSTTPAKRKKFTWLYSLPLAAIPLFVQWLAGNPPTLRDWLWLALITPTLILLLQLPNRSPYRHLVRALVIGAIATAFFAYFDLSQTGWPNVLRGSLLATAFSVGLLWWLEDITPHNP